MGKLFYYSVRIRARSKSSISPASCLLSVPPIELRDNNHNSYSYNEAHSKIPISNAVLGLEVLELPSRKTDYAGGGDRTVDIGDTLCVLLKDLALVF